VRMGSGAGAYGEWNIAGGTNTVSRQNTPNQVLYLGYAADATGVVNVTGGTLDAGYVVAIGYNGRGILNVGSGLAKCAYVWLGYGTGAGDLSVTGGTCQVTGYVNAYRGAALVNGGTLTNSGTFTVGAMAGKTSTLTIVSGTLSVPKNTTTVGNLGAGTLEVQGKNSTVTLHALTATTAASTLKFVLTTNGVTPITVNNALTVSADTKLVVDVTDYDETYGLNIPLITYGSKTSTIDEGNISIIGVTGATVNQAADNTVMLVLPLQGTLTVISAHGGADPGTESAEYGTALSQFVTNSPVSGGVASSLPRSKRSCCTMPNTSSRRRAATRLV